MDNSDLIGEDAIIQGVNYSLEFNYQDDAGAAIDLTGKQLRFVIFNQSTGQQVAAYSTETTGVTCPTPVSGISYLSIAANDTLALSAGLFGYKYEMYIGSTNVERLADGRIEVAKIRVTP